MSREQVPHILVAGGGVAAIEAVIALRALAGRHPHITLLTAERQLVQRPASVAVPFGFGLPPALRLAEVRRHAQFDVRFGTLASVEAAAHVAACGDGERIGYDHLLPGRRGMSRHGFLEPARAAAGSAELRADATRPTAVRADVRPAALGVVLDVVARR
jgi:sulfide:quinone oxidoreductase